MKKLLFIALIVVLATFFSIPAFAFADEGDHSEALGPDGGGSDEGQFEMNPLDAEYTEVPEPDNDDMDVYCIDEDISLDGSGFDYVETDINVSDELIDNGEDPDNAVAVEIMATTATGASDEDNQDVVWALLTSLTGDEEVEPSDLVTPSIEVYDAVLALATEFNALPENNDADDTNDTDLQTFLDAEGINDLAIYLDMDPFISEEGVCNNDFEATAIMAEPLVPEVTDECKSVNWYILAGSYNVSFASDSLVTETQSTMNDYTEVGTDIDKDGDDGTVMPDHYGMSTVMYYFWWWGDGFPEFEEMCANLGATVDIDEDCKIDLEADEVCDFENCFDVVRVCDGKVVKKELEEGQIIPDVETYTPCNLDIDYYNAGKLLVRPCKDEDRCYSTYEDVWIPGHYNAEWQYVDGHWENGDTSIVIPEGFYWSWSCWKYKWKCEETVHPEPCYQRFAIESYSEPFACADKCYERWLDFSVNKTDSSNGDPVAGALYSLTYDPDATTGKDNTNSYLYQTYFEMTTDANGQALFTGLPWGIYNLMELDAPDGYEVDPNIYPVMVGGSCLFDPLPEDYGFIDVTNDPTPGDGDGDGDGDITTTTTTPTVGVAGIIEVAGLAFTGMNPAIPIGGAGTVIGGLGLLFVSLIRRKK